MNGDTEILAGIGIPIALVLVGIGVSAMKRLSRVERVLTKIYSKLWPEQENPFEQLDD